MLAIVLARSIALFVWPDLFFEADEALTGLMAKHVAEGRAFPVFQYAHSYVLAIEAWLVAPLFLVWETSIALLKIVPVALNLVVAGLLYCILTSARALAPRDAILAMTPFVLTAPYTSSELAKAVGMNIEPFVFALLFWLWRDRPILLGVAAGIAVKNREFALYAITALLLVDLLRDRSERLWRGRLVALVVFASMWSAIELLRQVGSPRGADTTFAMAAAGSHVDVLASVACVDLGLIPRDMWTTGSALLPAIFGLTAGPPGYIAPLEVVWLWPVLLIPLTVLGARGAWRAWRGALTPLTYFAVYLVLIGMAAVLAYSTTRCGNATSGTLRYLLLALFAPVGAIALALQGEPRASLRVMLMILVSGWGAICAYDHVTQLRVLVQNPPERSYRRLATYLEDHGIQFIVSDYWTGYFVAFVTDERVRPLTNFDRVHEYQLAVHANLDRAVEVRGRSSPCPDGREVAGFFLCPVDRRRPR